MNLENEYIFLIFYIAVLVFFSLLNSQVILPRVSS